MPRNPGTGVYSKPSPDVITGTTIESTVYNTFVGDVETDLNTPRPVSAGGTGATSADGALINVSGEKATQLVTDYNTQVWFPGSFRSAVAANGAPNATSSFVGTAYINEALANPPTNQNVVLEARDQNDTGYVPGRTYVREKKAGVWSAWTGGIYAAPFDAMAYSGMQVNGSMEVSQERGSTAVALSGTSSQYVIDCWGCNVTLSSGVINAYQTPCILPGLPQALQITPGVAQATLTAGQNVRFATNIEGYRFSRVAWGNAGAIPVTVGFWMRAFLTGTYQAIIINHDGSTTTPWKTFSYTAGNYQWVTITFPAVTAGVWKNDNSTGAILIIEVASNVVPNNIASLSGYASIVGVIVLPGTQAPTAAQSPLIMRPYDQELVTCQRYYRQYGGFELFEPIGNGQCVSTTLAQILVTFDPPMRVKPTATATGSFCLASANSTPLGLSTITTSASSLTMCQFNAAVISGFVMGDATKLLTNNDINARLKLDARL